MVNRKTLHLVCTSRSPQRLPLRSWCMLGTLFSTVIFISSLAPIPFLTNMAWSAGTSERLAISQINQMDTGAVFVWPKNGSWGNPDGCTNSDRFLIEETSRARRELLVLVLSAHLESRKIKASFSGCGFVRGRDYPVATSITLY